MSYELFEKAAAINSEFDVIPTKTSILARGIIIDNNGYMQYKGKTYLPNMTKLSDLPGEIRGLFTEKKLPAQNQSKEAKEVKGKPTAIIAKTIKGKDVSFMENQAGWHGKAPNDEEYAVAMADLEKVGEALCQM